MKTAIHIPDALFKEAKRLVTRRGWSRREWYSKAIRQYIEEVKSGSSEVKSP